MSRAFQGFAADAKGKGKAMASSRVSSPVERLKSPLSLEALMSDLLLFKESLFKDLDEEVISALEAVYGQEALKGVKELLKDATPFKMEASVSIFFHFSLLFTLFGLFLI